MSNNESPSATWDAMTDQQKIEWLATKVMRWHKGENPYWFSGYPENADTMMYRFSDKGHHISPIWNPLTDWNHTMEMAVSLFDKGFYFRYERDSVNDVEATFARFDNELDDYEEEMTVEHHDGRLAVCKAAFLSLQ